MEFIIEKVIDAIIDAAFNASGLKDKVSRNEQIIRILKHFGLDDLELLQHFDDVYAYAVVEYAFDDVGRRKPPQLVQFFKRKEVRDLFQAAIIPVNGCEKARRSLSSG